MKPGVYMQEVTQETAEVISDNAIFDKGGRTLAAIQKSREHYKNVMAKWEEMAAEREAKAVDAFVDEILPSRKRAKISWRGRISKTSRLPSAKENAPS